MKKILFGICLSAITCSTLPAMYSPPMVDTEKSVRRFESWGRIISDPNSSRDKIECVFNRIIELFQSTEPENMSSLIQLIEAHIDLRQLFAVRGKSGLFAHAFLSSDLSDSDLFDHDNLVDLFAPHLLRQVNETDNLGNTVLFLLIESGPSGYNVALEAVRGGYADLSVIDGEGKSVLHLAAEYAFLIPEQDIPDYSLLHAVLDRCLSDSALSHLASKKAHYFAAYFATVDPEEDCDEVSDERRRGENFLKLLRETLPEILSFSKDSMGRLFEILNDNLPLEIVFPPDASDGSSEEDSGEDSGELLIDPLSVLLKREFFAEQPDNPRFIDLSLFSKFLKLMPNTKSWSYVINYINNFPNENDRINLYLGLHNNLFEWIKDSGNIEYILHCRNSSGMSLLDWFLETEVPCPEPYKSDIILHLSRIEDSLLLRNSYHEVTPLFRLIRDCKNEPFLSPLLRDVIGLCDSEILSHRSKPDKNSEKRESALEYLTNREDISESFVVAQEIVKNPHWNPAGEDCDTLCSLISMGEFWGSSPEKQKATVFQIAKTIAESRKLDLKKWGINKNLEVLHAVLDNFGNQLFPKRRSAIEAAIRQAGE
jgi:hypothetical protein